MGGMGAACFHTISDREREIPKELWDQERFGMVCTRSENFENWQTAIEQLCHESKLCDYHTQEQIEAFFARALAMRKRLQ